MYFRGLVLQTWQNCGHRAFAGVAIVAKTRTTKALILSPENTLEMRSPEKTLETMSPENILEMRTTTLVILPQVKQHGEPNFGSGKELHCSHHFRAWFNWSPKLSEFCLCSIRHHLCFIYGGDVVRCFLRPHKLQSPLKIQKYQYLSVKQSEKWSLLKGFTIHLWNMRLLWSPAASVLLSLSLYTNYCCFTAWARYEFETWATPWSSLTGLMSQARHQIAPWQMVV